MKDNQATKDIKSKAAMAVMGLMWVAYLIFHSLSSLSFFVGEGAFNNLYIWLNSGLFWRYVVPFLLFLSIIYHVYIAIIRQIKNLNKDNDYYKKYPKNIPRSIAWFGIVTALLFLIWHVYQMQNIDLNKAYNEISEIFDNYIFATIYIVGSIFFLFHIHHGLRNVSQSLAFNANIPVCLILIFIGSGFISIPLLVMIL